MPRSGANIYSAPAGTTATTGTAIESAKYNAFVNDLVTDANTPRAIVAGGTGATTLTGLLATLGGQPLDGALTSLAGLVYAANQSLYSTAADTFALYTLSVFARTLLDDADAATMRATLGAVIGTDVQAFDADLAAIAALATTGIISRTGAGTVAARTITSTDGTVTITNPGGVAGNINLAVAGGMTLLGTLTLSGGSQTLSSLTLTNYEFLRVVVVGATVLGFTDTLLIAGPGVFRGLVSSPCRGFMEIDLTDGTFNSSIAIAGVNSSSASTTYAGDTGTTKASTSIAVSLATQTFGGGTVRVYGIP